MSPIAEKTLDRLDAARQRWWLFTLLTSAVLAVSVSLAVLLACLAADSLWALSRPALMGLFLVWAAVTLVMAAGLFRRLLRGQRSLEATARRVEVHFPDLDSNLINAVQLADGHGENRAFRAAALAQAVEAVGQCRFDQAAECVSRWQRFRLCMQTPRDAAESTLVLSLLLALAVIGHMVFPAWGSAAQRLFSPWEFVPRSGTVEIVEVTPGDSDVLIGSELEITATIGNPQDEPYAATTWVATGEGREAPFSMKPDDGGKTYRLVVPSVTAPLRYRLEIGDSQTQVYRVRVRRKPTVSEVEVVYHYPHYLGRPEETVRLRHADIEGPQYTVAELRVRPSVPVAKGWAESRGMTCPGRVSNDGKHLTIARLPMVSSGVFSIHLENDAGHREQQPRQNQMLVLPDHPPTVAVLRPDRQSKAAPGEVVTVVVRAADDHGLGYARLEMRVAGGESESGEDKAESEPRIVRIDSWDELSGQKEMVLRHELSLDPSRFAAGQTVLVRAVAADQRRISGSNFGERLGPQETASPWHAIKIVDADRKAQSELAQLDSLRAAIYKILLDQIRTRIETARVGKVKQPERAGERVRAGQVDIQQATSTLAESIEPGDEPTGRKARRVLGSLANGEMVEAVRQAEELAKLVARSKEHAHASVGMAPGVSAGELGATQQKIIAALRGLLDVVRRAQSELLAQMQNRPEGDLPDDVREKLKAAKEKLEEFLRAQNKVIEATENLAKKPVEDFTEEEKELLRQLAAAEDDWARFLEELHSDLSKLPEQDFSNPSMLSELNEIQTEIKMAKDALTKKTADIAVPLEQLGAEMAEELLTNMEKWLPDTPDRERWSQEESLTDLDKEAPMAELPGELEDLIGELFEEEEDLFDEMEDVSSSAADSLDVGAGWDAMDGPISNMSAKGVTGNRLPNTSEVGGRAGEGRSGKSSGEFVGDEAVGKGGRRTPSRLTPDPYEKGQIKDHSKDPMGGATGGGKESGQGGEGLEGPQRRSPGEREMQRLAGRQAALRNKAEAIDLKFQIMNFHRTDLKKMIEIMAQVERDLKAGRYRNALRQRSVLAEGLGNVKQYVEGEVEVRRDNSVNLPDDVQKGILGGMQEASPAGWEELNRQYYERLSKGGTEQ